MSICARFRFRLDDFRLDVDLDLPERGITSLFGPSGCGKTSLLRAIAGLDRHQDGFLKFGDLLWQDATEFVPPHRRPIGYVFQEASLFEHLNVRGNLEYGLRRVPESERAISLERAIDLLGIAPLLARAPATLSGGERQRVAIARALVAEPSVLLCDEPTGNLDERTSDVIADQLFDMAQRHGHALVLVTHDTELAQRAHRVMVMHDGRLEDV